jgi:hypothetical protein
MLRTLFTVGHPTTVSRQLHPSHFFLFDYATLQCRPHVENYRCIMRGAFGFHVTAWDGWGAQTSHACPDALQGTNRSGSPSLTTTEYTTTIVHSCAERCDNYCPTALCLPSRGTACYHRPLLITRPMHQGPRRGSHSNRRPSSRDSDATFSTQIPSHSSSMTLTNDEPGTRSSQGSGRSSHSRRNQNVSIMSRPAIHSPR